MKTTKDIEDLTKHINELATIDIYRTLYHKPEEYMIFSNTLGTMELN